MIYDVISSVQDDVFCRVGSEDFMWYEVLNSGSFNMGFFVYLILLDGF